MPFIPSAGIRRIIPTSPKSTIWPLATLAWLAAIAAGFMLVEQYSATPGANGANVATWPGESRLHLDERDATLVMFVHPKCPCTRASLGELEKITARFPGRLAVRVVFFKPSSTGANWEQTDLWRTAGSLPGTEVVTDLDGAEARRFHATTSGQTYLFNTRGELLFEGGITYARGHSGDNAGRTGIETYLEGQSSGDLQTPVFGCPIDSSSKAN